MIFPIQMNVLIVERSLGSDYMGQIEIFTLPTCPICNMIKTKLHDNGYSYIERPFEELPDTIKTDRAPVLFNGEEYLLSPLEMKKWIEE